MILETLSEKYVNCCEKLTQELVKKSDMCNELQLYEQALNYIRFGLITNNWIFYQRMYIHYMNGDGVKKDEIKAFAYLIKTWVKTRSYEDHFLLHQLKSTQGKNIGNALLKRGRWNKIIVRLIILLKKYEELNYHTDEEIKEILNNTDEDISYEIDLIIVHNNFLIFNLLVN